MPSMLILLLWLFAPGIALSATVVPTSRVQFLISDAMSLENVSTQKGWSRVLTPTINYGFTDNQYWFKTKLDCRGTNGHYLKIAYPLLDQVEVFFLDANGTLINKYLVGDTFRFNQRPIRGTAFYFPYNCSENVVYRIQIL